MSDRQPVMQRIVVVFSAAVLAGVLVSGCARSPEVRRDKFMAAGQQYLQKKDYARAILQFRDAAQVMPKDPEVYYQLGIAYAYSRDYNMAVRSFQRTLALNPHHVGAELGISQIYAHTNNPALLKDAETRLNALLAGPSVSPDTLNTLALTEWQLGNHDEAIERLEEALAQSPGQLVSSVMLAGAELEGRDAKGAEEVLKKAVIAAPDSSEAHRFLGGFYHSQRKFPQAEGELRKSMELDKKNGMAALELAEVELAMGRKAEAEEIYRHLATIDRFQHAFGAYLFQQGRYEEAIGEFERLAKASPDDRQARTRLIVAYRAANRAGEAEAVLEEALKRNPKDFDALLQKCELLLARKKYSEAEVGLSQVIHIHPDSPEAHYVMAKLRQGRAEDLTYRSELMEALRLRPGLLAVRLELAQSLTGSKAPAAALEILNAAPAYQKELTAVAVQRNWAYWAAGDLAEMAKGIEQGLLRDNASTDLLLQDGMLKLRRGDSAGAQAAFERALKINPRDLRALAALSQSFAAQKKPTMAVQTVRDYVAAQPKSAAAQDLLGLVLLATGDRAQAREAFMASSAADPVFIRADMDLVRLDAMEGKWNDAGGRLKKILAAKPGDSTALQWLGDVEVNKGDPNAAIEQYQKAVESDPKNSLALNNLAYLIAEYRKQPDEALKYAEKAAELAPEDPHVADTLGWVLYQKGLYDLAIPHLKRAASAHNAICKYHLAMAYAKAGQVANAQSMLEEARKINSAVPEAQAASAVVRQVK